MLSRDQLIELRNKPNSLKISGSLRKTLFKFNLWNPSSKHTAKVKNHIKVLLVVSVASWMPIQLTTYIQNSMLQLKPTDHVVVELVLYTVIFFVPHLKNVRNIHHLNTKLLIHSPIPTFYGLSIYMMLLSMSLLFSIHNLMIFCVTYKLQLKNNSGWFQFPCEQSVWLRIN